MQVLAFKVWHELPTSSLSFRRAAVSRYDVWGATSAAYFEAYSALRGGVVAPFLRCLRGPF